MEEAATTDQQEDDLYGAQRGDDVPENLLNRQARLERLKACPERLKQDGEARAAPQQEKLVAKATEEQASGKGGRGRKPKAADTSDDPNAVASPTDPNSRIMKTRRSPAQAYPGGTLIR